MSLSKRIEQQLTVKSDGQLEIRETSIIAEDGVDLSRSHKRRVIDVGDDVTNESNLIKDVAGKVHTPEKIAARKLFLEAL